MCQIPRQYAYKGAIRAKLILALSKWLTNEISILSIAVCDVTMATLDGRWPTTERGRWLTRSLGTQMTELRCKIGGEFARRSAVIGGNLATIVAVVVSLR